MSVTQNYKGAFQSFAIVVLQRLGIGNTRLNVENDRGSITTPLHTDCQKLVVMMQKLSAAGDGHLYEA